jgi:hypothetical protein
MKLINKFKFSFLKNLLKNWSKNLLLILLLTFLITNIGFINTHARIDVAGLSNGVNNQYFSIKTTDSGAILTFYYKNDSAVDANGYFDFTMSSQLPWGQNFMVTSIDDQYGLDISGCTSNIFAPLCVKPIGVLNNPSSNHLFVYNTSGPTKIPDNLAVFSPDNKTLNIRFAPDHSDLQTLCNILTPVNSLAPGLPETDSYCLADSTTKNLKAGTGGRIIIHLEINDNADHTAYGEDAATKISGSAVMKVVGGVNGPATDFYNLYDGNVSGFPGSGNIKTDNYSLISDPTERSPNTTPEFLIKAADGVSEMTDNRQPFTIIVSGLKATDGHLFNENNAPWSLSGVYPNVSDSYCQLRIEPLASYNNQNLAKNIQNGVCKIEVPANYNWNNKIYEAVSYNSVDTGASLRPYKTKYDFANETTQQNLFLPIDNQTGTDLNDLYTPGVFHAASFTYGKSYQGGNRFGFISAVNFETAGSCNPNTAIFGSNDTVNCIFPLSIPTPFRLLNILPGTTTASISTATGNSDKCTLDTQVTYLTCNNLPTAGATVGNQTVSINLNGTNVADKAVVTINPNNTNIDWTTVIPNCDNSYVGGSTTCSFKVKSNNSAGIENIRMFVDVDSGAVVPGGSCTLNSTTFTATCLNVPVGNSAGVNNIYVRDNLSGRDTTKGTLSKTYVAQSDKPKYKVTYSPVKSNSANYKSKTDISINLNSFKTALDPQLIDDSYTCKFELGSFGKSITDTTGWTSIANTVASPVSYNETNNTGCSTTLTDTQKLSVLGLNILPTAIRITVTPTNSTDPTGRTKVPFVFTDNYMYKIGGIVS